jgi:hypothetical protein
MHCYNLQQQHRHNRLRKNNSRVSFAQNFVNSINKQFDRFICIYSAKTFSKIETSGDLEFTGPGTIKGQVTLNGATFPVVDTVVFSDYDRIKVRFVCGEIPKTKGMYTAYLISVRDRNFNDLTTLQSVVNKMQAIDCKLNTIANYYQGPLCHHGG